MVKPIDLFRFQTDRRFASHLLIRAGELKGYMFLAVYYRGAQDTDSVHHPLCTVPAHAWSARAAASLT
ncbi:MAG: hypothetical protein GX456_08265 [Verrucomicrobia bacterium]|nr:hypothetical protein [Verrucomicrobiota bacterium]